MPKNFSDFRKFCDFKDKIEAASDREVIGLLNKYVDTLEGALESPYPKRAWEMILEGTADFVPYIKNEANKRGIFHG